jgi:hypothetical protein
MSWRFNPPPGWPAQPAGWTPPPGWTPDPSWPPPPAGWQFWVAADPRYPPAPPYPAGPALPRRPWFARWWGIAGLVAALVVGGLLGFGGTNLVLADGESDEPTASPDPLVSPLAETASPELALPSLSVPSAPSTGGLSDVCGEVAVILLVMVGDQAAAADQDDPRAALAETRRTAATSLRELDASGAERNALDTFADELDSAADYLEEGSFTERRVDEFVNRTMDAWDEFDDAAGC